MVVVSCGSYFHVEGRRICSSSSQVYLFYTISSHKFWLLRSLFAVFHLKKKMGAANLPCFSSLFGVFPLQNNAPNKFLPFSSILSKPLYRFNRICCGVPESGIQQNPSTSRPSSSKNRMEDYNLAMKKMMRNPYEYHHELGQFLLFLLMFLLNPILYVSTFQSLCFCKFDDG